MGGILSCISRISRRGKRRTVSFHLNRVGISSRISFDQELGVIIFSDSDLGTQLFLKSISVLWVVVHPAGVASFILDFLTRVSGYLGVVVWVVPSDISSCISFPFKL